MEYVLFGALVFGMILVIALSLVLMRRRIKDEPANPQVEGEAIPVEENEDAGRANVSTGADREPAARVDER